MLTAQHTTKLRFRATITGVCVTVVAFFALTSPIFSQMEVVNTPTDPAAGLVSTPTDSQAQPLLLSTQPTPAPIEELTVSSLTAIPPRLGDDGSLVVSPGDVISETIQVRNNSEKSITIRTSAQDFIVEDGETPIPVTDDAISNKWSLKQWLVIVPPNQVIKPNELGQVNVIINVPQDALPGGHYAMITHQPAAATADNASGVNQKVGTLLYVIVDGPINERASVQNLSFKNFSEYGPVPYSFSVLNQSDVHINPNVKIEIKNMLGKVVDTIVPESKNIFPENDRQFAGTWNKVWGFGIYTAEVIVNYGTTGQVASSLTSFWIIPVKLIMAIVVVILVLIASFVSIRRHLLHTNSDEQKRITMLEEQLKEAQKNNQQ